MATALSRAPAERVTRAALLAYVFALMGVGFAADPVVTLVADGITLLAAGRLLFSCCVVGNAVVMLRNPDELRRGRDPAPMYLWMLAGVSTGATAVMVLIAVS